MSEKNRKTVMLCSRSLQKLGNVEKRGFKAGRTLVFWGFFVCICVVQVDSNVY